MTQTRLQLRTSLRVRLREIQGTQRAWLDTALDEYIAEAMRDLARKTECLSDTADISITAGTQEYSATQAIIRVHRAEWRPTGQTQIYPLEAREFNTMDGIWWTGQAQRQGTPQYYATWGFPPDITIVLYPTPTVNGTLRLFYARQPAAFVNDSSVADIPEGWHDLALDYAEYRAWRQVRDDQRAAAAFGKYTDAMTDLMATIAGSGPQWNSAPGRMVGAYPVGGMPLWLTDGGWY